MCSIAPSRVAPSRDMKRRVSWLFCIVTRRGVGVERVGAEEEAQLRRGLLAREDVARDGPRGEVEDGRELRVNAVPARVAADEEARVHGVCVEDLADHPHARVLPAQGEVQVAYEGAGHVLN